MKRKKTYGLYFLLSEIAISGVAFLDVPDLGVAHLWFMRLGDMGERV